MKRLTHLFDGLKPRFEGGLLGRLKPLFEAIRHFFLWPKTSTPLAPYVRDPLDVKRFMTMVIVALALPTLVGLYLFGLRVLAVILVSYVVGGTVEVAFACIRREEINEGFLVTGLIFPLVLPPGIPLWMVGVGIAAGVVIGKELFGGTGRNPFNAALVGRAVLTLGHADRIGRWIQPVTEWPGRLTEWATAPAVDAVTQPTPLASAAAETPVYASTSDLFWGDVQGCIGETSAAAILVGAVILVVTGVANWRPIVAAIGTFVVVGGAFDVARPEAYGPVGWHLLAGGFLFGVVYMATDPVTSPMTRGGKLLYGILIGGLVVLIRHLTGYVEGVTFAILLGNIAAPTLDEAVVRWRIRRRAA